MSATLASLRHAPSRAVAAALAWAALPAEGQPALPGAELVALLWSQVRRLPAASPPRPSCAADALD